MEKRKEGILSQYDKNKQLYLNFLKYFLNTIEGIVIEESIVLQSIESRVKTRESLEKKIELKEKYRSIEEITDICGIRIITYFSDDVDKIANMIKRDFELDEINSVDKRETDDPTKFGYVSLHYIASLKADRLRLSEAHRFKGLKIEIQIRTILQHAWAEIEHDMGYKAVGDIPIKVRRSFSRLAGVIELADEEFVRIKDDLQDYSIKVQKEIKDNDESEISIDLISIKAFVYSDGEYLQNVKESAKKASLPLLDISESKQEQEIFSLIVKVCNKLDINNISELKRIYFKYVKILEIIQLKEYEFITYVKTYVTTPLVKILRVLDSAASTDINSDMFITLYEEIYLY